MRIFRRGTARREGRAGGTSASACGRREGSITELAGAEDLSAVPPPQRSAALGQRGDHRRRGREQLAAVALRHDRARVDHRPEPPARHRARVRSFVRGRSASGGERPFSSARARPPPPPAVARGLSCPEPRERVCASFREIARSLLLLGDSDGSKGFSLAAKVVVKATSKRPRGIGRARHTRARGRL